VLKLSSHVQGGELALAPSVAADPEVAALLKARGIEPRVETVEHLGLPYFARVVIN
jgi:hypothetical protein